MAQIALYESWDREGRIRLIKSSTDLDHHLQLWQTDGKSGVVLLMEGADPIVEVSPLEIDTVADLYKVGLVVPEEVREAVLGVNWLNFLRAYLPQNS